MHSQIFTNGEEYKLGINKVKGTVYYVYFH